MTALERVPGKVVLAGLPVTQARGQAARAAENFRFFADMAVTLTRTRSPPRASSAT